MVPHSRDCHRVPLRVFGTVMLALMPCAAAGQSRDALEITPFGGYRFGGGLYEIASGRAVDVDGAASFGLVVDIPFSPDMQIEAMVTHQEARFVVDSGGGPAGARWRVTVDHYQLGGLTEFGKGRARPFLTGALGLTRYGSSGDNEVRLSAAAGGGVKLFPTPHVGVRLEGRLFGTLVDADVDALFCGPNGCIGSIDAWFVWQAELTAGVTFRF